MRRACSRTLAVFCVAYLLLVLLFHRHLVNPDDRAVVDDYNDASDDGSLFPRVIPRDLTTASSNHLHNNIANSSDGVNAAKNRGAPLHFQSQLQQLEVGMTQLERQIAHMKSKLAEEVMTGKKKDPVQGRSKQDQQQARNLWQQQHEEKLPQTLDHQHQPGMILPEQVQQQQQQQQQQEQQQQEEEEKEEEEQQEQQHKQGHQQTGDHQQQPQEQQQLRPEHPTKTQPTPPPPPPPLLQQDKEHHQQLQQQQQQQQPQQQEGGQNPPNPNHPDTHEQQHQQQQPHLEEQNQWKQQFQERAKMLQMMMPEQGPGDNIDTNYHDRDSIDYGDRQRQRRFRNQQRDRYFRQPSNMDVVLANGPARIPKGNMVKGGNDPQESAPGQKGPGGKDKGMARPFWAGDLNDKSSVVAVAEGVFVYSAYHDDRQPAKAYVRVLVIVEGRRRMMCHFESPALTAPVSVEASQYELCENHRKRFLGFIFSCPVPETVSRAPQGYTLSLSSVHDPEYRVKIPVQRVTPLDVRDGKVPEDNYQYKYNFSICVSPLFGSVLSKRLVEFLEMTRLLGVQQVFFYNFHVSDTISRVLNFYQDKGWVTVLPWKLPAAMREAFIWYHGQLISNNDCLYRNMALSAFTAFHDIDELIVPRVPGVTTWSELLPRVLPNDTCGYSFQSAFFDPSRPKAGPPVAQDQLQTVRHTARTSRLSHVRTKVLLAPQRVFEVGIHHISKQSQEHWQPRPFNASLAILHHYRECIGDYGMSCQNWVQDRIIPDTYLPRLYDNFLEAVKALKL